MTAPLFEVRRLGVAYGEDLAVRDVSLRVEPGEAVAIVGESGSGKTQTLYAALGLLDRAARVTGSARFRGQELVGAAPAVLDRLRGDRVTFVFQEPSSALDPLTRIGEQIASPVAAHGGRDGARRARELLDEVGVGASRLRAYPHELSGGERQRVMIAMALANDPDLLIADEPTTALDATVQKRLLNTLDALRRARGLALILVTHDLRLARRYTTRAYVMQAGRVLEEGVEVFSAPREAYTQSLIAAAPARPAPAPPGPPVLACRRLSVDYGRTRAVEGVDLTLHACRTLAIVGESGSGKSTLARALLRLQPAIGEIEWKGRSVARLEGAALRRAREATQIVFQDPWSALSPRLRVAEIVAEGLAAQGRPTKGAAEAALRAVGLDPALASRRPDALSGGQRQRVAIARALALEPAALVLDEPTSSLDRAAQRDIVAQLGRLQAERGLAYLFITHDLELARALADDVIVMRRGKIVERGTAEEIFARPRDPYVKELIAAADLAP
jgi:oligopeptide transport system ATP-binding protein